MLIPLLLQTALGAAPASKVDPDLAAALATAGSGEFVPVIVALDERVDMQQLIAETEALPKHQRASFTRARLEGFALRSQAELNALIETERAAGRIAYSEMLWTCNAHLVQATPAALARIAALERVARVTHDPNVPLELVQDVAPPPLYSIGVLPYATSFESGALPAEFHRELTGQGQAYVTADHGPASDGTYHLALDGAGPGSARAVLHLNLSAVTSAILSFDIRAFDEPTDPQDVLSISIDGTTYKTFAPMPPAGAYRTLTFDLGLVAMQQGLTLGPDTRISFGWGGSGGLPSQGYVIDKLSVVASGPPLIAPEPNISALQAPTLWAVGVEGLKARILIIDDGVQSLHPALAPQRWTNPGEVAGNGLDDDNNGKIDDLWGWDFVSNDNNPSPIFSEHGTNTAGIVCGNGAFNNGVRTGMAPLSTWAAALVNGEGSMLAAYQYAIAAGFDCITSSHSWKWPSTPNYPLFRASTDAELAAGIIHANSIGNQGALTFSYPIPYNIGTPGNCPAPWSHPQQVQSGVSAVLGCAGIFLGSDALYTDSGQGPAAWEDVKFTNPNYPFPQNPAYFDYPYLGGTLPGLLKPDLAAYVNVKTTNGATGYNPSFGGTSAATPHLGGALCLMIDANPSVPPRQVAQALQETALDLGLPGKDLRYGAGKIRVYEAALRILSAITAYPPQGAIGTNATFALTGPAGSPYILAAGFGKVAIPTTLGITIGVGNPIIVLGSGTLNGHANPLPLVLPIPNEPLLSGFQVHFQLFTDDSNGPSKRWLASLIETFKIL
ncbi:MAG: hypothetical protein FJ299_00580 [Planctomycetes bacterium]|nr:hypothetical protein [Planctomycetota bacterium]